MGILKIGREKGERVFAIDERSGDECAGGGEERVINDYRASTGFSILATHPPFHLLIKSLSFARLNVERC